jgi:BirA family transcriptional regulator, biotin operon repressor / biotin---[acetyl-CoA-carboxylase] ligase
MTEKQIQAKNQFRIFLKILHVIGQYIIQLDQTVSTNLFLQELLKKDKPHNGTLVVAKEQTGGKGQFGNKWYSRKGENLTFSFVLYPDYLMAGNQFNLSKFVSLALFDTVIRYLDNVKIKWPNDLFAGQKKIAGILIENTIRGTQISTSIIGIGLNVNQKDFPKDIPNASSLHLQTGIAFNLTALLEELLTNLNIRLAELRYNMPKLDDQYIKALYQYGEYGLYQDHTGIFEAKIDAIDEFGRLCLVDRTNQTRKYAFKEVRFL